MKYEELRRKTGSRVFARWLIGLGLAGAAAAFAADSTISPAERHAWSANGGWLSFRHDQPAGAGVVVGERIVAGFAWSANFGWLNFGDGTPADGIAYSNATLADFGVNHDGAGNLGGYAWGANIGWVRFGWASPADPERPRVNLLTGQISGYAWGANVGWIRLGPQLSTLTLACTDTDLDGIGDEWEIAHFDNLEVAGEKSDFDKDGADDLSEYTADTDPQNPADRMRIVSHDYDSGFANAAVGFTSRPTRVYRIFTSEDLGGWDDSALGLFLPDPGPVTVRQVAIPGGERSFIRVVSAKPLQP